MFSPHLYLLKHTGANPTTPSPSTTDSHISHTLNHALDDMPNFVRCPTCPSGQIHEPRHEHDEDEDPDAPQSDVVVCAACHTTFCLQHRTPLGRPPHHQQQHPEHPRAPAAGPHDDMSCAEYDAYLADPQTFRSAHERAAARAARDRREAACMARARARVERLLLLRGRRRDGQQQHHDDDEEEEGEENRENRERVARQERARYDEARRRADAERREAAAAVLRRRGEEACSEGVVARTTKACPRCGRRIEKDEGCMHMTCE